MQKTTNQLPENTVEGCRALAARSRRLVEKYPNSRYVKQERRNEAYWQDKARCLAQKEADART